LGSSVNYVPKELALGGVPVPEALLPQFAASINLLIDTHGLCITPLIREIRISAGAVILTGTAEWVAQQLRVATLFSEQPK